MKHPSNPSAWMLLAIVAVVAALDWKRRENANFPSGGPHGNASFQSDRLTNAAKLETPVAGEQAFLPEDTSTAEPPTAVLPELEPAIDSSLEVVASIHQKLCLYAETDTGNRQSRHRIIKELTALLTDDNASMIAQSMSADELATPFGVLAVHRWMGAAPLAAANWVAQRPDRTEQDAFTVATKLSEIPGAALNFCQQLPDSEWKQQVLVAGGQAVASSDPVAAITFAQQMPDGANRTDLLQTVAHAWFARDLSAAAQWIMSEPDPELRDRLIVSGAKAYASADPKAAANWIADQVGSGELFHETTVSIVDNWAAQRPREAADWIARLVDGATKNEAELVVARQWLKTDPAQASKWINALPNANDLIGQLSSSQLPVGE